MVELDLNHFTVFAVGESDGRAVVQEEKRIEVAIYCQFFAVCSLWL